MTRRSRARVRGFTLIELMVVAAIIGLLASVAIPTLQRATLRSRVAERATIMTAIARAITPVVQNQQGVPGGNWTGVWNPPGVPGPSKRSFDYTLLGWTTLPMVVEGNAYYSYQFVAVDGGTAADTTLDVFANGDLDGDGNISAKQYHYVAVGYFFGNRTETPPLGQEDVEGPDATF